MCICLARGWRGVFAMVGAAAGHGATRPLQQIAKPGPSLSGSWQQGHSAAYSTPFLIRVVCRGSIGRGRGNCDRARLKSNYPCTWLPPPGRGGPPSGVDSSLEAFSCNPAHGSFAATPFQAAAVPMVRIGGSSRTEPNYRWRTGSSRVKLTCLTTV